MDVWLEMTWVENATNLHLQWFKVSLVPERTHAGDNDVKMVKQCFNSRLCSQVPKMETFEIPNSYGQWFGLDDRGTHIGSNNLKLQLGSFPVEFR